MHFGTKIFAENWNVRQHKGVAKWQNSPVPLTCSSVSGKRIETTVMYVPSPWFRHVHPHHSSFAGGTGKRLGGGVYMFWCQGVQNSGLFNRAELSTRLTRLQPRAPLEQGAPILGPHKRAMKVSLSWTHFYSGNPNPTLKSALRKLNLPTLKFRRIRGDMIEVYKIFNEKYDEEVTRWLRSRHYESHYDLRGHQFNIYQS